MQPIRVALIQLPWSGSREAMMANYRVMVAHAAADGASLVCLPELSLSPYFPSTTDPDGFAWSEPLYGGPSDRLFSELAEIHRVTIISSIFERARNGATYNTAVLHSPEGALIGSTHKIHFPVGTGYNETDFFMPGTDYPVFAAGAVNVAAPTCYDQWFPELARIYSMNGAEFLCFPTAIGAESARADMDTRSAWQTIMRGHAIANGVFVGAANRVGVENGIHFYGSSFICDPMGNLLAQAGRDSIEVITADLDPATLEHWRSLFPLMRQRMPHTYGRIIETLD